MQHDYLAHQRRLPELSNVRVAAKTAVFEVQAVDLHFANGQRRTYERLTPARRPAVMVLPFDAQGNLLMIREYSVGSERYELTLVKGLIDSGETAAQAANRELQEEIGFACAQLIPLRALYTSPGHMYSPMQVFAAYGLTPSRLDGDEPEPLEIVPVPPAGLDVLIDTPEFGDARVLAALMLWQRMQLSGSLKSYLNLSEP